MTKKTTKKPAPKRTPRKTLKNVRQDLLNRIDRFKAFMVNTKLDCRTLIERQATSTAKATVDSQRTLARVDDLEKEIARLKTSMLRSPTVTAMHMKQLRDDLAGEQCTRVDEIGKLRRELQCRMFRAEEVLTEEIRKINRSLTQDRTWMKEFACYKAAMGPLWTTAEGHTRPMGLLTTNHLERIKGRLARNPISNRERLSFIDQELNRRSIDRQWRAKDATQKNPPATAPQETLHRLAIEPQLIRARERLVGRETHWKGQRVRISRVFWSDLLKEIRVTMRVQKASNQPRNLVAKLTDIEDLFEQEYRSASPFPKQSPRTFKQRNCRVLPPANTTLGAAPTEPVPQMPGYYGPRTTGILRRIKTWFDGK